LADAVLIAVAILFGLMGLGALARPALVLAQFGVSVDTGPGRTEVRAVYGGFGLAMAAALVAAVSSSDDLRRGVVIAVAAALAGMAAGRLAGALAERDRRVFPTWVYLAIEAAGAAALVAAA